MSYGVFVNKLLASIDAEVTYINTGGGRYQKINLIFFSSAKRTVSERGRTAVCFVCIVRTNFLSFQIQAIFSKILSMRPYSSACFAVMKLSLSVSLAISSIGRPVFSESILLRLSLVRSIRSACILISVA